MPSDSHSRPIEQQDAWQHLASSVFEHAHDSIIITDSENRIIAVNPAFTRYTGYTEQEVLGLNPGLLHSGKQDQAFYQAMWADLREKGYWQGELWDRRKDGADILCQLSISVIRNESGQTTHHIGICTDITRLKLAQRELEKLAHFDALTELPNRNLFYDRLRQALPSAQRNRNLVAVGFLDLDNFKPVNDRFGHAFGDRLLVEVANRLRLSLRGADTVARLGGDEFVILLTELRSVGELEPVLERLLRDVAAPFRSEDKEVYVSASLGITLFPLDQSDPDALLRHADQAMYQAKQEGRNRFHLFDAEQDRQARTRREQISLIHEALTKGEFALLYQPKVNLRTGKVIGMEALLRWDQPGQGLILPGQFLPLVENSEFMVTLGRWTLQEALTQMVRWNNQGLDLSVSVNIATKHLQHSKFVDELRTLLEQHPEVQPAQLELEILESATLEDLLGVGEAINECRRMGVRFALDDFGTGYSSLSHLRQVQADTMKIDQSFVRSILDDPADLTLVEGVIGLGASFQRDVIAEGVETPEHGVILMRLGCDLAQGHAISQAIPATFVADWVRDYKPNEQWALWADTRWEMSDFPLLVAQYDHLRWVKKVVTAASGGPLAITPSELSDHRQCRFGHWYYHHGQQRYGYLPEFQSIERVHLRVHQVGPEIIRRKQANDLAAVNELVSELLNLKDQILEYLNRLSQAVAHSAH
jgi:diguanylate cyclase (GGDEF)-like protein/PAS domain S-box-containing protein